VLSPSAPHSGYWLTRFVFLRFLGLIYFVAFLVLVDQAIPLIGENGLLPAQLYLRAIGENYDSAWAAFLKYPTVFWFFLSDGAITALAWLGAGLSFLVLIGFANAPLLLVLWFLYMSFIHIGQLWYGYGWEIQLLETGFLGIFLCPLWDPRPFPRYPPPLPVFWLLRWMVFRIYIGAGLIKIRGDFCWRDLTCLNYHFETQPLPNPLSAFFHHLPWEVLRLGVAWSHFCQLVVPWFIFHPRPARHIAGFLLVAYQCILILSGNLSFLNWLTITATLACFDDGLWARILPRSIVARAERAAENARPSKAGRVAAWALVAVVALLSIGPVSNLFSRAQIMNTSFNRLHLVNTYGAFGSVGKVRRELIIEGTMDEDPGPDSVWKAYEFKAKPGDPDRTPPWIAPFHYRLDWQIWFAAMSIPQREPWLMHFIWKLLANDRLALSLIDGNPFPDGPPKFIRVEIYKYELLAPWEEGVWKRNRLDTWFPPISRTTPGFAEYMRARGWN